MSRLSFTRIFPGYATHFICKLVLDGQILLFNYWCLWLKPAWSGSLLLLAIRGVPFFICRAAVFLHLTIDGRNHKNHHSARFLRLRSNTCRSAPAIIYKEQKFKNKGKKSGLVSEACQVGYKMERFIKIGLCFCGVGALSLLLGFVMFVGKDLLFDTIVRTQLAVSPTSGSYPMWKDLPAPIKTSMFVVSLSYLALKVSLWQWRGTCCSSTLQTSTILLPGRAHQSWSKWVLSFLTSITQKLGSNGTTKTTLRHINR